MTYDPQFLEQIGHAINHGQLTRQSLDEQRLSAVSEALDQEAAELQARFDAVIAEIPACVRAHVHEGRHYGRIMRLRFDESGQDPRWPSDYWESKKPDPNLLVNAALQVMVYCHQHKLKPYLVRDYDFDVRCFFFYIGIDVCHHIL